MKIGEIARVTGVSIDSLRYYEKLGLLAIARTNSGIRRYCDEDTVTIRFIKQAQKIGFSLDDIAQLVSFRAEPEQTKPQVRGMITDKLELIAQRIDELHQLHDELSTLVNQCHNSSGDCPILKRLEEK